MKLIFERAHSLLVTSEGMLNPLTFLEARRGDGENIELVVIDEGAPITPTGLEQFRFIAKNPAEAWDEEGHALASTWVRNATSGRWQARVNYNTEKLNALLKIGVSGEPENKFVDLDAQFGWRTTSTATLWRSQNFTLRLHNSVLRGSESGPVPGTPEETGGTGLIPQAVVINADVVNNTTTLANITDLLFPVQAGARYHFRFVMPYNAAATTTGARLTITGPASPTFLAYRTETTASATARGTTDGHTAYDLPSAASLNSLLTGNLGIIEGIIKPSADGHVQSRVASEVGGSAITIKAGACCIFTKLDA